MQLILTKRTTLLLLLRPQKRSSNITPRQPHIRRLLQLQHHVHTRELGPRPLQRRHTLHIHVRLDGQILLRHGVALLVLEAVARLHEGFGDFFGDFFGRDGAVGAVDFG